VSSVVTPDWNEARARDVIAPFADIDGGLLPALNALQAEFGYIPKAAVALIAQEFNISKADVFGTVTFYHDYRFDKRPGRHVLKLCRAEACQALGAVKVADAAKKKLNLDWHQTGADGEWTLEPVFCLGLCASGPAAMLDGQVIGGLDDAGIAGIIEKGEA